jgi:tetratricopeptide (TPR) repeat protein
MRASENDSASALAAFAVLAAFAGFAALAAATGCASLGGPRVETAQTGEKVLRTSAPLSFARAAEAAYGDSTLGRYVARIANLRYEDGLPRGAVLVLPARESLQARVREEETADRAFRQGLAAADVGQFRQAADHFREALRSAPNRVDVRYNLGLALMQAGELSEATDVLEAVAAARPDDPETRYAFGSLLRRRRAHVRAYEEFDAALRADGRHVKAAFARAKTLEDLEKWDRAERAWRDFLADFPGDPLAESARRSLESLPGKRAAQP